jgi:hypothetical protein
MALFSDDVILISNVTLMSRARVRPREIAVLPSSLGGGESSEV